MHGLGAGTLVSCEHLDRQCVRPSNTDILRIQYEYQVSNQTELRSNDIWAHRPHGKGRKPRGACQPAPLCNLDVCSSMMRCKHWCSLINLIAKRCAHLLTPQKDGPH